MKKITLLLFSLLTVTFLSCSDIDRQIEEKLDRINEKAEKLDSIVKSETQKVLTLDSLIILERDKLQQLDSLVNTSASQFDSIKQQKIDQLKRILK